MILKPKNWGEFQHYKKRSPPWIKLHNKLLDDFKYHRLQVASRALAPLLWLLASEYQDGKITADPEEITFRFRRPSPEITGALLELIGHKFFEADQEFIDSCKQLASEAIARQSSDATPETETEAEILTKTNLLPKLVNTTVGGRRDF